MEKWPIWEQFFLSEEPDWLANSKSKGRVPTWPPTPPPPTARAAGSRAWKSFRMSWGFRKNLRRDHGGGHRSQRGRKNRGNPLGQTKIYESAFLVNRTERQGGWWLPPCHSQTLKPSPVLLTAGQVLPPLLFSPLPPFPPSRLLSGKVYGEDSK